MKCSESWIREWVNPKLSSKQLGERLTMSGLEVESITPAGKDHLFDISITPNRGDCLSIQGMARELAAITNTKLKLPKLINVKARNKDKKPVAVKAKNGCPRYLGRVVKGVQVGVATPEWMKQRLEEAGINSINPIVDITNYVMLELGQPMHAFDLAMIQKGVEVRWSRKGEMIELLDGSEKKLNAETLVIADNKKPLAIAGVMGGMQSGVTSLTQDIFLESAYFAPAVVAQSRQAYGLNSDSAYRFERGVDSTLQRKAIERATELVLKITGGEPGPVIEVASKSHLPKPLTITLEAPLVEKVLGIAIAGKEIEKIFTCLQFPFKRSKQSWRVQIPAYRSDITLPQDLIEEIARLYGYDKIPTNYMRFDSQSINLKDNSPDRTSLRAALVNQGFHEIISYSFVDKKLQTLLDPERPAKELLNPISAEMSVMRTSLWPGLVATMLYNASRQQQRVRLFEIGLCFATQGKNLLQEMRLGGLISGYAVPEQWGLQPRLVDFFDLKGYVENVLGKYLPLKSCFFRCELHPALHPGQTAAIFYQDKKIGIMGALHPAVKQTLGLTEDLFLFELSTDMLAVPVCKRAQEISKFPEVRRDLALLIKETVPSEDIQDTIVKVVGDWLKDIFIFDVYQGKGISPGLKSVALALILQHPTRTLVDDEVAEIIERVIAALKGTFDAQLRS